SAQIREILISESAWEEMTCLFAPSLVARVYHRHYCHTILSEGAIIRAVYIHLPEIVMDPDPTPHPRWSNLSFR
ncbi:mgtA regulatory leader peptide MgtL, partial [Klebsiella pneumoniae]|uniref:mgtA regulatory leader peptide MgtL n=1 Tax=Klebsiella pneumoniae TaxID=573 RepID=UPI003FA5DB82